MALNLPTPYVPSDSEVAKYLNIWQNLKNYVEQDKALQLLVQKYPNNTNFEEVLLKCTVLNFFYSTNIKQPFIVSVAQHICSIQDFDNRVKNGDMTLPQEIADNSLTYSYYFSFATKYCSLHNPIAYPISDSLVKGVLYELGKQHNLICIKNKQLDDYKIYTAALDCLVKTFQLNSVISNGIINYRLLDRYLWVLAKTFQSKPKSNTAKFNNYYIKEEKNGSIKITKKSGNKKVKIANVKSELRKISNMVSFQYNNDWNTRHFGKKLIEYINSI